MISSNHYSRLVKSSGVTRFSGLTKFRLTLTSLALFYFFSGAIYITNRIEYFLESIAIMDSYFVYSHNIIMATCSFASIPLADFQVFEYNHKFWDIFKSIATFSLLIETESIIHCLWKLDLKLNEGEHGYEMDSNIVMVQLMVLSIVRWFILTITFWKGHKYLESIRCCRILPKNFYVSFWVNCIEYAFIHLFAYILFTHTLISPRDNVILVCVVTFVYISFRFLVIQPGGFKKSGMNKVRVN